jgi:hypothetical protein
MKSAIFGENAAIVRRSSKKESAVKPGSVVGSHSSAMRVATHL